MHSGFGYLHLNVSRKLNKLHQRKFQNIARQYSTIRSHEKKHRYLELVSDSMEKSYVELNMKTLEKQQKEFICKFRKCQTFTSLLNPLELNRSKDFKIFRRDICGIRITTVYCFLHGKGKIFCSANFMVGGVRVFLTLVRPSS